MRASMVFFALLLSSCGFKAQSFLEPEEKFYGIEITSSKMDNEHSIIKRKLWLLFNAEEQEKADLTRYKYILRVSVRKESSLSAIESDAFLSNKTLTLKAKYILYSRDGKLLFSKEDEIDGSYSTISSTKLVSEYMTDKSIAAELARQMAESIYYSIRVAILRGEIKLEN